MVLAAVVRSGFSRFNEPVPGPGEDAGRRSAGLWRALDLLPASSQVVQALAQSTGALGGLERRLK